MLTFTYTDKTRRPYVVMTALSPNVFAAYADMRAAVEAQGIDPAIVNVHHVQQLAAGVRLQTL